MIFVMVVILGVALWSKLELFPTHFADISFHMANANGFEKANGPLTWNYWEAIPDGRPNNYPPVFHIFLTNIMRMGASIDLTVKIGTIAIICGGILLYALGISKLFDQKVAFFATVPLIFSSRFIFLSSMILPATFVLFFSPWLIIFLQKKRYIAFGSLALLMLYTHMIIPNILLLVLFVWAIYNEKKIISWKKLFMVYLAIYGLYLPWMIPIVIKGINYIKYFTSSYHDNESVSSMISIDLLIYLFGFLGVIIGFSKKYVIKNYNSLSYFLCLGIIFLPISFIYSSRGVNGHGYLIISLFFGFCMSYFWSKKYLKILAIGLILLVFFNTLILRVYILKKTPILFFEKSSIRYMWDQKKSISDWGDATQKAVNLIKQNSRDDDTIAVLMDKFLDIYTPYASQIHIANYLGVRADRLNVNMRQPEIFFRDYQNLGKAKILITSGVIFDINHSLGNLSQEEREILITQIKSNFSLIEILPVKNFTNIYVYKNNSENVIKSNIPRSSFPLWLADLLIIGITGLIVWDYNKKILTE